MRLGVAVFVAAKARALLEVERTSMARPHAAGIAALWAIERQPAWPETVEGIDQRSDRGWRTAGKGCRSRVGASTLVPYMGSMSTGPKDQSKPAVVVSGDKELSLIVQIAGDASIKEAAERLKKLATLSSGNSRFRRSGQGRRGRRRTNQPDAGRKVR